MTTVAVLGLGQMGAGMALRLAESGFDVRGFDVDAGARDRVDDTVAVRASAAEAMAGCEIVLTSLPNPAALQAAWLGEGGVAAAAEPGALCIELSTVDPGSMRDVAVAATARGLAVLDCPVSGSPQGARAGQLVLIAGGEPAVLDRARPVLAALGPNVQFTGAVGTAKVVKIVNNMMSMGNVLVAAEAFALGEAAGVDPETLFAVLSQSGGRSHHFLGRWPKALRGDFAPGFKLELGEKDLALAVELGRQFRVPTPAASQVREVCSMGLASGFAGQDIVALLALYRRWAGG
jgi:3-hydroxyisobutyrate dehydrogenase-like beta-hydroxyacid dehydrogenase